VRIRREGFAILSTSRQNRGSRCRPRQSWATSLFILIACLAQAEVTVQASSLTSPSTRVDFQEWNELDVSAKLAERIDLTWVSRERIGDDLKNPSTFYSTGVDVNFAASKHLTLTPSFYYVDRLTAAGQRQFTRAPILAVTLADTWDRWTLSDRSRLVGALSNGGADFWVFQNRPRIDYRFRSDPGAASVFLWDEISYYSNYATWKRNRIAAGTRMAIGRRCVVDFYYLRQDDSRSRIREINAVGTTLELRIRP